MAIYLKEVEEHKVSFDSLSVGTLFLYGPVVHMKVKNGEEVMAVNLCTGDIVYFGEDNVIPAKGDLDLDRNLFM